MAALPSSATRILVVDDTDDVRELYARYLTFRGYEVIQAADGQQAVTATRVHRPAVIIMDLNMPVMDGWTAIKTIKSDSRTKGVPVIVVTGNAQPAQLQAARDAGGDAVLQKPCAPDVLLRAVEHALRGELADRQFCAK